MNAQRMNAAAAQLEERLAEGRQLFADDQPSLRAAARASRKPLRFHEAHALRQPLAFSAVGWLYARAGR
jgi:hypothetical protein